MSTAIVKMHGYEAKGMDALETINTCEILNEISNDNVEDTEIVENLDFTQEEVVLGGSYSPEEPIKVSNKTTLKMGENSSITGPVFVSASDADGNVVETDSYGIHVVKGGDLTIDGDGVIDAGVGIFFQAPCFSYFVVRAYGYFAAEFAVAVFCHANDVAFPEFVTSVVS